MMSYMVFLMGNQKVGSGPHYATPMFQKKHRVWCCLFLCICAGLFGCFLVFFLTK